MQTFQLTERAIWYGRMSFAPDGLRCAAVDSENKLVIWDVDV